MRALSNRPRQDGYGDSDCKNFDAGEATWDEETDYDRALNREPDRRQLENKIISLANDKISLLSVLEKYNLQFDIKYSTNGWTHICSCPFKDHNDKSPSFGYNSVEDRFYCFGCHRSGRVVQFVAGMEDREPINVAKDLLRNMCDSSGVVKSKQVDFKKIERLLFEFAERVCKFRKLHCDSLTAQKYVDDLTWGLDLYIEKNAIGGALNVNQIELIINRLQEHLEDFEV